MTTLLEYLKNRPLPNPKLSCDALSNFLQVENPTQNATVHAPERQRMFLSTSFAVRSVLQYITIRYPIMSHYMCEISVL